MADLTGWRLAAVAAGAGAVAGLGQVPFSLVPVALAALALCCGLMLGAATWRRAAWIGWIAGAGYFAVTLHWIVEPFLIDVPRHACAAPCPPIPAPTCRARPPRSAPTCPRLA